jgi:hypothetical protein
MDSSVRQRCIRRVREQEPVYVILGQVLDTGTLGVEPGQELDDGPDLSAVGARSADAVTAAGGAAASVADDVPVGERPDDVLLAARELGKGSPRPQFELGQGLVAGGQDAGADEQRPNAMGGMALG